jgi:hypothetical protein
VIAQMVAVPSASSTWPSGMPPLREVTHTVARAAFTWPGLARTPGARPPAIVRLVAVGVAARRTKPAAGPGPAWPPAAHRPAAGHDSALKAPAAPPFTIWAGPQVPLDSLPTNSPLVVTEGASLVHSPA